MEGGGGASSFRNKGMREKGGGAKRYYQNHTAYLKKWHEMERMRSHAIDKTDLKDEWMYRLEMDIKVLKAATEKVYRGRQALLSKVGGKAGAVETWYR